jgi:hypothetical protein
MESNKNSNKGYTPIEPDIYDKLNWDYDLIVQCLEYIRNEIPNILKIEDNKVDVFLVSLCNFLGQNYPAIGIRCKSNLKDLVDFDFFEIDEKIETWLDSIGGVESLKQKSKGIKCIDWKT